MAEEKKGFFSRLVAGLTKTRNAVVNGLDDIFNGPGDVDDDFYDELEEILITSDIGMDTTIRIMEELKDRVMKKEKDFVREAGKMVDVSLYEPLDGSKQITGKLIGCEDNALKLEELEPIDMKKIAQVRLHIDI